MKQNLQTLLDKNSRKQTILNIVYCIFVFALLYKLLVVQLFANYKYGGWAISEFLINYQGGFVRRGLTGEILLFLTKNFGVDIIWTIKLFCLLCFTAVCTFFVRAFLKKGYSLYILPLCFFLGIHILGGGFWVRKDHLMLLFFIATLLVLNKMNKSIVKFLIINTLVVIALLIHEAFAFFVLPVLFLLVFNEYKNKKKLHAIALSLVFLLPSICVFLLTLHYHGDLKTAQIIWDSWVAAANLNIAELNKWSHGALSSIGWTSKWAFEYHFRANFLSKSMGILSLFFWIMIIPVVYYIVTNALLVFRKNESIFTSKDKTALSSVLVFQFVCLLPFFLVLSCDLGRIIFYWIASSFAIFLLIPKDTLQHVFPLWFVTIVQRFNTFLITILSPTKTALVFLMMFVGISAYFCEIESIYKSTMLYNVLWILSKPFV